MGLDQYAFCIDDNEQRIELCYWRKHPNLQGWMEHLWKQRKYNPKNIREFADSIIEDNEEFNCVDLQLDYDDLNNLEIAVKNNNLPSTSGFFFGDHADFEYKETDLEFIEKAKNALSLGYTVYYSSWW